MAIIRYKVRAQECLALLNEMVHGYRASIAAAKRGDHKAAVKYQLQAVDSANKFNSLYLKELDLLRKGGGRQVWAP